MRNMEKAMNMMLYKRIQGEQEMYRRWLCKQTPEEILKHAAEYVTRENILQLLDKHNLTAEQANALVQLDEPLAFMYQKVREEENDGFWDGYLETIKDHADRLEKKARLAGERGR